MTKRKRQAPLIERLTPYLTQRPGWSPASPAPETSPPRRAVMDAFPIVHPFEPELSFLYGAFFTGSPSDTAHHGRNVCIFADGEVDRIATGSGVSARAALHHARGDLRLNEPITIESVIGTTMTVAAVSETMFGPHSAVIPEVAGTPRSPAATFSISIRTTSSAPDSSCAGH